MPDKAAAVAAKAQQRKAAKRATLDLLRGKKPRRLEFNVALGEDEVSFLYVAIGSIAYDALLTKHPPTDEERLAGAGFHAETFAPALLARVCREPEIDEAGWAEIYKSDAWGRGEFASLFWRAQDLCNEQVPVNPIVAG